MAEARVGVGQLVRLLRERRGLSQRALSEQAGLSPSYIGKLEAGETDPHLRTFASIATKLKMTSEEIVFCVMAEAGQT